MSFPNSPRLVKGGIVQVDPKTLAVLRIIPLQYNPDTLTRTLQVKSPGEEGKNRSDALRLSGPPVETLKLEVSIDATDGMEMADPVTAGVGIQPLLSALETIIYPTTDQMLVNNNLEQSGTLEIIPMETPLALFIWSKNRVMPVRINEFSITEEAFDPNLNPIRAKINLGMRVLSTDDLGFNHKGGSLYFSYQQNKEHLASIFTGGKLKDLGLNDIL